MTELETYLSAVNLVQQYRQMYPEWDMLDTQAKKDFLTSMSIIHRYKVKQAKLQEEELERMEQEDIRVRTKSKSSHKRKPGKLARFEEDVKECIRQGYGEERQLLEEAYNRKNVFARANYIKAYWRAVDSMRGQQ